jgi:saccharopine dehydrogenase (NAD+, L-lysine-forming)
VTQAYCAYAKKHEFDTIDTIDILDCKAATTAIPLPPTSIRGEPAEVSAPAPTGENGHWVEIPRHEHKREYDFDQVGQKDMYPAAPR